MRNQLLSGLSPEDLRAIEPHLEPAEFPAGATMQLPDDRSTFVFFVERGLLSIVMPVGEGRTELGLVGPEGMIGLPAVLGTEVSAYEVVARTEVTMLRLPAGLLSGAEGVAGGARDAALRFAQAQVAQLAHNSFANGQLNTTRRLARWLLMAHDRIDGDHLRISHNVVSSALGAHRPGVTVALHELEGDGAIRSKRNSLTVLNRAKLKEAAGPAYGPAEAAYAHLFGRPLGTKT